MRDLVQRFSIWRWAIAFAACAFLASDWPAYAAVPKTPALRDRTQDEAAVRQAGKDYLAAMESGDKKAMAQFWTADGTFTDEAGHATKVRELLDQMPAGKPARRVANVANLSVRFVADGVALEEGDCDLTPAGATTPVKGHFTALWVRQEGRWKLDNLRESRGEPPPPAKPTGSELAVLDVFVGDWSGEVNQLKVHITAKWNVTKRFLRRDISISDGGQAVLGATQEIGWDPLAQKISSWIFSDDGSFGEATWSLEGHVWMAAASRLLPDGKVSSAIHVFRFRDKDTLVWKSIKGTLDGQPVPDFEVTLKRTKAEK